MMLGTLDPRLVAKRNFQVFDPLDFLAEVTQHIPDPGQHLILYYGWYSNKTRGARAEAQPQSPTCHPPAVAEIPARKNSLEVN